MTSAEQLPERKHYRPPSLAGFFGKFEEMGAAEARETHSLGAALTVEGDARVLEAPRSARPYDIRPGNTLCTIAAHEMTGEIDCQMLALHNRNVGLLFEGDELYAGAQSEIPVYDCPASPVSKFSLG